MNRRLLLASIATLSAGQAFAQKMSPPAPAPSAMTDAQQKHIRDTTAYGSLSLLLSRMAKSKVTHPLLKQFVDFEIAEQETVGGILKAIQTNAAPVRLRLRRRAMRISCKISTTRVRRRWRNSAL